MATQNSGNFYFEHLQRNEGPYFVEHSYSQVDTAADPTITGAAITKSKVEPVSSVHEYLELHSNKASERRKTTSYDGFVKKSTVYIIVVIAVLACLVFALVSGFAVYYWKDSASTRAKIVNSSVMVNESDVYTFLLTSCRDAPMRSGVYEIYPTKSLFKVRVFCDQTTDGGGWIVFQRRKDGIVNFNRDWEEYKAGFGYLEGEFWLGNNRLFVLTSAGFNELRIDLKNLEGDRRYVKYSWFGIKSEQENYQTVIIDAGFTDITGDTVSIVDGMPFSTKDRDHGKYLKNCSIYSGGAWWFNAHEYCYHWNLNGFYDAPGTLSPGISWQNSSGAVFSWTYVEMKIR